MSAVSTVSGRKIASAAPRAVRVRVGSGKGYNIVHALQM